MDMCRIAFLSLIFMLTGCAFDSSEGGYSSGPPLEYRRYPYPSDQNHRYDDARRERERLRHENRELRRELEEKNREKERRVKERRERDEEHRKERRHREQEIEHEIRGRIPAPPPGRPLRRTGSVWGHEIDK